MPSTYLGSTYATCALWQGITQVKYNSNPKSGKSFVRYAKYENSRTIAESLQNGSKPEDLLYDYQRGHLQVTEPLRKEPLDPFKMKPADFQGLTEADQILIRYGCRHDPTMKKGGGDRIKDIEKNLKNLRKNSKQLVKLRIANRLGMDSTDELEGCLDGEAFAQRLAADQESKKVLEEVAKAKRKITEHEVVRVLNQWGFAKNPNRINVMREGITWVHSDTIGAMARRDGLILPTATTAKYPNFVKVITTYLADHMPKELKDSFVFTSININKDYAGARHRDQGNSGPSVLKALGDFTGGELVYFPSDAHTGPVEDLAAETSVKLNVGKGLALFDGNRAHEVTPFKGSRYSLVFFSCRRFWKMPSEQQKLLQSIGITYPTNASIDKLKAMIEEPAKCGAAEKNRSAKEKLASRKSPGKEAAKKEFPGYGYWPSSKEDQAREVVAKRVWKDRPLQDANDMRRSKKKKNGDEGWSVTQQVALGTANPKALQVFEGYNNVNDAVEALNEKAPSNIAKLGYCSVYSNRTKCYYVVYHREHTAAAMKAAGFSSDQTLGEMKEIGLQRIKDAGFIRGGTPRS